MTLVDRMLAERPKLMRYARQLTRDAGRADDLVQSTYLRAIEKQHLYVEDTDLRAWLFTILHNANVNRIRKSIREGLAVEVSDAHPEMTARPSQDARLQIRDVDRALAMMPAPMRKVVMLIGVDDLSYEEAADVVGLPVGTVRSRLSRGREMLRYLMEA